jgi:hypothetical protein
MGVPTSEVEYTSATTGRGDHEIHKGHMVAMGEKRKKKLLRRVSIACNKYPHQIICVLWSFVYHWHLLDTVSLCGYFFVIFFLQNYWTFSKFSGDGMNRLHSSVVRPNFRNLRNLLSFLKYVSCIRNPRYVLYWFSHLFFYVSYFGVIFSHLYISNVCSYLYFNYFNGSNNNFHYFKIQYAYVTIK